MSAIFSRIQNPKHREMWDYISKHLSGDSSVRIIRTELCKAGYPPEDVSEFLIENVLSSVSKEKGDSVFEIFTPFGVMVGDAGAYKSFNDDSFYDEVLKPSEKAMYEKYKKDFIKKPKSDKVSAGFIPWKKLIVQSKSRNHLMLNRIMSNTWALNKEAIPGFVDLIEKLRSKYSTVLGDDKLLEYLEAAQHRARELEVSGEVSGSPNKPETNSSLTALKSAYDLDIFYKSKPVFSGKSPKLGRFNYSRRVFSGSEGVDQQAYNNYVQQLVAMGMPEDQARQQADQMVAQIKQNTAQFIQNIQQPNQQGGMGLASSFKRYFKSGNKQVQSSLRYNVSDVYKALGNDRSEIQRFYRELEQSGLSEKSGVITGDEAEARVFFGSWGVPFLKDTPFMGTYEDEDGALYMPDNEDYYLPEEEELEDELDEYNARKGSGVGKALKEQDKKYSTRSGLVKSSFDDEIDDWDDYEEVPIQYQIEDFISDYESEFKMQADAICDGVMTVDELRSWIEEQLSCGYTDISDLGSAIFDEVLDRFGIRS